MLSPVLFSVYFDEIVMLVVIGVVILLVLSAMPMILFYWLPLLRPLSICDSFATSHGLIFNADKTHGSQIRYFLVSCSTT